MLLVYKPESPNEGLRIQTWEVTKFIFFPFLKNFDLYIKNPQLNIGVQHCSLWKQYNQSGIS